MKISRLLLLLGAAGCWLVTAGSAQTGTPNFPTYKTGPGAIAKLGRELRESIKAPYRERIQGPPISVETDDMPFVKLAEFPDDPKPLPVVLISQGFIDLINNVAHAKAIDKIEKDYFHKYILSLAQETGEKGLKPLPNDSDSRFWTDDMINEQYSNFNSIVGVMIGIKLANHYLGQYTKYAAQINAEPGKQAPINNRLTPKEWDEALKIGVRNALDAGCTIEGVLPFFQSFESMPKRPPWTAYFMPDNAKYRDIRRTLERLQKDFFAGKE